MDVHQSELAACLDGSKDISFLQVVQEYERAVILRLGRSVTGENMPQLKSAIRS